MEKIYFRFANRDLAYYHSIVKISGFTCFLCNRGKSLIPSKKLIVQHNHKTGYVRGFACESCNRKIFIFNNGIKEPLLLIAAAIKRAESKKNPSPRTLALLEKNKERVRLAYKLHERDKLIATFDPPIHKRMPRHILAKMIS